MKKLTILLLAMTTSMIFANSWQDAIVHAHNLANGVQVAFTDGSRDAVQIKNRMGQITAGLRGENPKLINIAIGDKDFGGKWSFDTFVTGKDGRIYYTSKSGTDARFNAFRLGYYYYDVHIMDQIPSFPFTQEEINETPPVDARFFTEDAWAPNEVSKPTFEDGIMKFQVLDTHDPWIASLKLKAPTAKYRHLEVTMRTEVAHGMHVYLAVGPHKTFNPKQIIPFGGLRPNTGWKTHRIAIDQVPDFTGDIHGIRFDVGSQVGETIEIKDIKLVGEHNHVVPLKLDRIFHAYPDKIHQTIRFVAGKKEADVANCGVELVVPKNKIKKVIVKDKNGIRDSFQNADRNSIEFVGFDDAQAGVLGLIFPPTQEAGQIILSQDDNNYILRQIDNIGETIEPQAERNLGHRIHLDPKHDFNSLIQTAAVARKPLTDIKVVDEDGSKFAKYDFLSGAYEFSLAGTGFNEAFYQIPQRHFKVMATITGDDTDRSLYIRTRTSSGGLEAAALLDENDKLVPIPLEVSKNFRGEKEEPYFYPEDHSYGETVFPITLAKNQTRSFTVLNLYQNWGKFPLKQLSSIQFFISYYHLSTGVTETNCIAPYYVHKKDGWTLPDFRAMSAKLWSGQPQHYSVGSLYYPYYMVGENKKIMFETVMQHVNSEGPVYADVDFEYKSDDNKLSLFTRHLEMPQTDENRTYYQFDILANEPIQFDDFKNQVNLFGFSTAWTKFNYLGYLDQNNKPALIDTSDEKFEKKLHHIKLGNKAPYFTIFHALQSKTVCNFALLVKDITLTQNGKTTHLQPLLWYDNRESKPYARLTLDLDKLALNKGDILSYNLILLPFGDYDVANDQSARNVREDTLLNPVVLSELVDAQIVPDTFLPRLETTNDRAQFTIAGGENNIAIRIDGFKNRNKPTLEVKDANGNFVEYITNHHPYDGYQVIYNPMDKTFGFAFIVKQDNGKKQTFRVKQD